MTGGEIAVLVAAALGAGVMNALAGGGTILTFPVLVLVLRRARVADPTIVANATSTVALVPGAMASMFGYRREVATHRAWLNSLVVPSVVGGAAGSVLLLQTPERVFADLAPFLVLFATLLFLVQTIVGRRLVPSHGSASPQRLAIACLFQLGVALYGGYFGAGIGILMLVALGFLGLTDIHAMNGLKNFFGICINAVAAAYFIACGKVEWPAALAMAAGAIAGGFAGATFGRWVGQQKARVAVVVIGFVVAGVLLFGRS